MKSIRLAAVVAMIVAAVAACSSGHPAANKSPQAGPPLGGGQSPSATATATPSATGTTTVDPCQLVTPQEASAVTGASYSSGTVETDSPISRRCVYGAQTPHVFEVIFVQGDNAAQAQAYANNLRAEAEQKFGGQVAMSQLSGIGDDAEQLHANGSGIDISGLYIRQGRYGLALVDVALGHAATIAALTTQAQTSLGRLPSS